MSPEWNDDGGPANVEAALADALEWLLWLQRSKLANNSEGLRNCIAAARKYLPDYEEVKQ